MTDTVKHALKLIFRHLFWSKVHTDVCGGEHACQLQQRLSLSTINWRKAVRVYDSACRHFCLAQFTCLQLI